MDVSNNRLEHKAAKLLQQFFLAIKKADDKTINALIKQGIDVNSTNHFNITPLEFALKIADHQIVALLLNHGAKIKSSSSYFYQQQLKWHNQKKHRLPLKRVEL